MLSGITISFRVKPGKPRFWLTALEADFKQNICKAIKLYKVKTAWHPNIYLLPELICVVFLCKLPGVIMHKDSEQNYRCSVCSSGLILQEKKTATACGLESYNEPEGLQKSLCGRHLFVLFSYWTYFTAADVLHAGRKVARVGQMEHTTRNRTAELMAGNGDEHQWLTRGYLFCGTQKLYQIQ